MGVKKNYMVTKGFPLYPETIKQLEEIKEDKKMTWDEVFKYLLDNQANKKNKQTV